MFDVLGITSALFACILVSGTGGVARNYSNLEKLEHPLEKKLTNVAVNDAHTLSPSDLVK